MIRPRSEWQRVAALVVCVAAAVSVAGCGARETRAGKASVEGVLLVGNGAEPQELDPHLEEVLFTAADTAADVEISQGDVRQTHRRDR